MDTCRSRTVDHGPLLAYGLFRLPAPAARTAPSADTGCAHTCVSRRYTVVVVVVVIDSIGTPTAVTNGQRDFVVFLALKKKKSFFPRRPYSWSPHHHTLSPALLVPRAPINQNLHFGCPYSLAPLCFSSFLIASQITSRTPENPDTSSAFLRY